MQGVEAYVAFTTDRHHEHPLVVQGAGVGGALTAGAVLAEIFRLAALNEVGDWIERCEYKARVGAI